MGNPNQFAVLQKELISPTAEQLKRAFKSFSNLTDADAVRLAVGARGILMRHLGYDAARALHQAVQAEGVPSMIVPENDLPRLPEARSLHRIELTDDAFVTFDLLGRPTPVPWNSIQLVAAGGVQHFEMTRTQSERTVLKINPILGLRTKTVTETGRKVESDLQLLVEIILPGTLTRFQIEAEKFPFRYIVDLPGSSVSEKVVWIVRAICSHIPGAIMNAGASSIYNGGGSVADYPSKQSFADEIVWLLWQNAHARPGAQST